SRVFSNQIKVSFRTYLNVLRTNHAASLIKISDDNLEDIATDSGFESTRSFYRIFKDIYGVSPSQYRKMIRRYSIY
ncbi:MAG: helix-turn-helix domain-containing protein, partial [Monoglobus pectinilyticus]